MIDVIHFYRVKSLEKVRAFYEELLGFPLYKDQGKCLIYDSIYGKIGFCTHFPEETSKSCITFVYDTKEEVNSMYKTLIKKGIKVEHPPEKNDFFKIHHFFANDFNGLTLEFQCFSEEVI